MGALMQVVKNRKISELRGQLSALDTERNALAEKRSALEKREAELTEALDELNDESTEEEKTAVDEGVKQYEADDKALKEEEDKNQQQRQQIEEQIAELQRELEEIAKRTNAAAKKPEEKKEVSVTMDHRKFFGMSAQERDAFFARGDVKDFLSRMRAMKGETRAVTGAELTIPTVMLDMIRERIEGYSKLYKHVNVRRVSGKARANIMGTIPEAVWTEMCATLNELSISFSNVEVDGYKVGGYIAICNAVLEDSDVALATEIINAIGQAIGLALDKAILYGTGTKMPLGIVTRLAQTAAPAGYSATAREWKDLSATNVVAISGKTGAAIFQALVETVGKAKSQYSTGSKFWAMNETTYTKLVSHALTINAAGAIATGMTATMPIIGGAIEQLSFIPDDVIIGGYGDLYLLAERAGVALASSEHVRFIEDQTVFKGTARYDGTPVIAEGFVAIGIGGTKPSANAVSFVPDTANTPASGD